MTNNISYQELAKEARIEDEIKRLADLIKNAKNITVLTGAGISTESGIPDFKSTDEDWKHRVPREVALSQSYFDKHPENFWHIFKELFQLKMNSRLRPNSGHKFFKKLEDMGKRVNVLTQNVDGLHQKAKSSHVYELHGTIKTASCKKCAKQYDLKYINKYDIPRCNHVVQKANVCNEFISISPESETVICKKCKTVHTVEGKESIRCKGIYKYSYKCSAILKPDVVLYENQPKHLVKAKEILNDTDLLIVAGTSLEVFPVNQLPSHAKLGGETYIALVNKFPTPLDYDFHLVIHNGIGDTFKRLKTYL